MIEGRKIKHFAIIAAAFALVTVLIIQCWPFTLMFFLLGMIASFAIDRMTGGVVPFGLVLLVEFLLMVCTVLLALWAKMRQMERKD